MARRRRQKKDSIEPTPEQVATAVQLGFPEIFEEAGATIKRVAELTAKQLRAKRWVKEPGTEKYRPEPDWVQVNAASERIIRINGAYSPEKSSHTVIGDLEIAWATVPGGDHEDPER